MIGASNRIFSPYILPRTRAGHCPVGSGGIARSFGFRRVRSMRWCRSNLTACIRTLRYGSTGVYWVHFGGEALAAFNDLQEVQKNFKPELVRNTGEIIPVFQKIYKTLELGYSIDNLLFANMCLSQFLTLFIYNKRHYASASTDRLDCVDSAIHFMQEHINDNISLISLSKTYNYSVSRFSNLFKQKTGYAPIDNFLQMKMQKACQLLDFSDRSIKDISFSMGFEDPYYFSKRFRKIIGVSPRKYRMSRNDADGKYEQDGG
jgi:AraC family transcriptional regulator, arabinose operon regulatory protein